MSTALGNSLRIILLALFGAVSALVVAAAFGPMAQAAVTTDVSNACDVVVSTPAKAAPGDVVASPGDTVRLTADSNCTPVIGPVTDPKTGVTAPGLVSGDGISIAAPGVTLDLNGHNIHSTKDILAEAQAQGLDVENAGVSVGAANVTVTNSSTTAASLVDNFTANYDFGKGSDNSKLVGQKLADGSYNLVGGDAHGGGILAIDRTQKLTIDTVKLVDLAEQPVDAIPGDNGIDWKRCTGPNNTLTNSLVKAPLAGMRVRGCTSGSFLVQNNTIGSSDPAAGVGLEFTRDVKGATVSGNTISNNGTDGVAVRGANENISITGNTIHDNGGAGIFRSSLAKNITTAPNDFLNNALGNVVVK